MDISQAFPVGELGEGHAEELIQAEEALHLVVAVVSCDTFSEPVCGDKVHLLSKDRFPGIAWAISFCVDSADWHSRGKYIKSINVIIH